MKQAIFVDLHPIEGMFDTLATKLETMLQATRKAPGCMIACLCRNEQNNELVIWHMWETTADFDRYLEMRTAKPEFHAVLNYIDHELTERAYDVEV